ncbi:MAG: hypothetical protein ACYTFT_00045 [Planctomycetota bacterium]
MSSTQALLLDDHEGTRRVLALRLRDAFPDLVIEERSIPDGSGRFDLYFIDNRFGDQLVASRLAANIREQNPDAFVVAFSSYLDRVTLKELIHAGCDGACDKGKPEDLDALIELTARHLEARKAKPKERVRRGFVPTLRALRDLLHAWNSRLDAEEAELSHTEVA